VGIIEIYLVASLSFFWDKI